MCKTKFKYLSVCKSSVVIVEESLYYDRTCNLLWRNLSYLSHFNCNNTSFSCNRYRILGTRQILNIDHKEGNLNTTDNIFSRHPCLRPGEPRCRGSHFAQY